MLAVVSPVTVAAATVGSGGEAGPSILARGGVTVVIDYKENQHPQTINETGKCFVLSLVVIVNSKACPEQGHPVQRGYGSKLAFIYHTKTYFKQSSFLYN